jgi:hypothetical protein
LANDSVNDMVVSHDVQGKAADPFPQILGEGRELSWGEGEESVSRQFGHGCRNHVLLPVVTGRNLQRERERDLDASGLRVLFWVGLVWKKRQAHNTGKRSRTLTKKVATGERDP